MNFHTSCEGIFEALVAIFHDIRWEFAFFHFLVNLPCYSMGILHFFHFSSIFHVIQWEICIFLLFCKFSMLFNGKLLFVNFPCYSIKHFAFFHFFINFPCYSMEVIEIFFFVNIPCYSMVQLVLSNPIEQKSCVLQDIVPFGAAALLTITYIHKHTKQGNRYR